MSVASASFVVAVVMLAACGSATPVDPRYPPRPEGCDVKLFHDVPSMPTDNLGPVRARCGEDVAGGDCMRTLLDEACKLGGDVVWGVPEAPEKSNGKILWSGRAAHTRGPRSRPDAGAR